MLKTTFVALFAATLIAPAASAQTSTADWAAEIQTRYQINANVTYLTADGYDSKMDIYRRRDTQEPQPTLVFYHGGGWVRGSKEASLLSLMPWFEMGWNIVNVEYRMLPVALAPAAVEDAQCALRFLVGQAKQYGIDVNRIVVTGESAGGHLALTAGMIPQTAGFTNICSGGGFNSFENAVPKVAAIINWYGITDVAEMLSGPGARSYAVQWVGSAANRQEIAKSVSPLTYIRAGLPPVLTIHGDKDPIVPYTHGTRLHEALGKASVTTELFTVPGGGHGGFKADERVKIYAKIREFLGKHGLLGRPTESR